MGQLNEGHGLSMRPPSTWMDNRQRRGFWPARQAPLGWAAEGRGVDPHSMGRPNRKRTDGDVRVQEVTLAAAR